MTKFAASAVRVLMLAFLTISAALLILGLVRFSAIALAIAFLGLASARAQGVLPTSFQIRRARTDIVIALTLAVALATLALALPRGR